MVVQGIHKVLISEHGPKKALPSCYRFTLLYSSTILGSREKFQWFLKDDNCFFNLTAKMTICPLCQYKSCSVSFWILFWNCFRILKFFSCIWICSLTMVIHSFNHSALICSLDTCTQRLLCQWSVCIIGVEISKVCFISCSTVSFPLLLEKKDPLFKVQKPSPTTGN